MISTVLDERRLPSLRGQLAIAHCRYSTTGSTIWENAQPTYRLGPRRALAIGHNGNLVNTRELLEQLRGRPRPPAGLDRHGAAHRAPRRRAGRRHGRGAACASCRASAGAYSLVVLDERRVIGVRDPFGFRPLVLGRLPAPTAAGDATTACGTATTPTSAGASSSETAALDIVGAEYVRDVEPGEMVILEPRPGAALGPLRRRDARAVRLRAHLLRPARLVHGGPQPVRGRRRMGEQLAGSTRSRPTW